MNIREIVKEVGYFETSLNLLPALGSADAAERIAADMPLPSADIGERIEAYAKGIAEKGKKKIFLLTPEIALIEKLAEYPENIESVLIVLPSDMDPEMCERIGKNLLKTVDIQLIREPFFPEDFSPKNGVIAVSGFLAGGRTMVSREVYRMTEHYGGFLGQKLFLPYADQQKTGKYDGWLEISHRKFHEVMQGKEVTECISAE